MELAPGAAESFWGSARDLGLTSIAVLTFAGLVYEYTYLHDLGIDFAAVDISPSSSLIAMSKVATADVWTIVAVFAAVSAIRFGVGYCAKHYHHRWAVRALRSLRLRTAQTALALLAALAVCVNASATASASVDRLRSAQGANRVVITFRHDVSALYPAALLKANLGQSLDLVYDSPQTLFVMVQPKNGAIADVLPDANVYELHKDDVLSLETIVPPLGTRR